MVHILRKEIKFRFRPELRFKRVEVELCVASLTEIVIFFSKNSQFQNLRDKGKEKLRREKKSLPIAFEIKLLHSDNYLSSSASQ